MLFEPKPSVNEKIKLETDKQTALRTKIYNAFYHLYVAKFMRNSVQFSTERAVSSQNNSRRNTRNICWPWMSIL